MRKTPSSRQLTVFTARLNRASGLTRAALSIGLLAATLLPAAAPASPRLRCQLSQGDTVQILDFAPAQDPYSAKAIDIKGNFRFKAVVIGNAQAIDYIKIYAYYQTKRQAVLLHEVKYLAPVAAPAPDPAALTGTHALYSPDLGRELQYACALFETDQ